MDCPYTRFRNDDGWEPYLITTAASKKYELIAANLVDAVLTKTINGVDYPIRLSRCVKVFTVDSKVNYNDYGVEYEVPVSSTPALEGTEGFIVFREQPAASSDKYICRCLWEPPSLESESIPLAVPFEFEEAIMMKVIGDIQGFANGNLDNSFLGAWENIWKPKWLSYSTGGAQLTLQYTPTRRC
jgi:hypothetical protein